MHKRFRMRVKGITLPIEVIYGAEQGLRTEIAIDGHVMTYVHEEISLRAIAQYLRTHAVELESDSQRMISDWRWSIGTAPIGAAELHDLTQRAKEVFPIRVACYAQKMGVTYGRITIRHQRTRWGSCSSKGNLNFNCLLMLAPPEVLNSVVIHELCHCRHLNHSAQFYAMLADYDPNYETCQGWLRQNGSQLIDRMLRGEYDESHDTK